jgi:hypothetical protein
MEFENQITSITGNVYVYDKLELPVCTSIIGDVSVYDKLELPVCTSIIGNVYVYVEGKLELPVCTSITGNVSVYDKLEAPLILDVIYIGNYKYSATGCYRLDKKRYDIRMGCYNRTYEEWIAEFWNNPKEFNGKDEASKLRLKCFNDICKSLGLKGL